MELQVKKELKPCPVCGSSDINWNGYYYVSLICKNCHFVMWPLNDFASEETDYEEWNNLDNLENAIKECKEKLQKAKEDNNEKQSTLRDLLIHYESLQRNMDKARENLKI